MSYRRLARLGSLAATTFLAACGGDSPSGPSSDVLSDTELLSLAIVASAGAEGTGTTACPAGGNVTGAGSSDFTTSGDITTVTFDVTVEYQSCALPWNQLTITLDGDSQLTGLFQVRQPEGGPAEILQAHFELTGTLRWRGDGVDLTCALDVTSTFQPATNRYSVVGRVCGRDVSHTMTA